MYACKYHHSRDTQIPAGDSMSWPLSMWFYRVICESNSICPLHGFAYLGYEIFIRHTLLQIPVGLMHSRLMVYYGVFVNNHLVYAVSFAKPFLCN